MTATQNIQLFQILQEHFGKSENAAKAVSAIEAMVDEKLDSGTRRYEELLHKDLEILRSEMKEQGSRLGTKIAETSTTSRRWMIGLFIPLYLSIIGLIITLLLRH
jgi:hypothetical protein